MLFKAFYLLLVTVVASPCLGFRMIKAFRPLLSCGRLSVRDEQLYLEIIKLQSELYKQKEKELLMKDKELLMKDQLSEKAIALVEKDLRLQAAVLECRRLEAELLRSAGLLSARGLLEKLLKECRQNDPYLTKQQYTASSVATFIDNVAGGTLYPGERANTVKEMVLWANQCVPPKRIVPSWRKLYGDLSNGVHRFPWSGRDLGVNLEGMTDTHMCLIKKMAQHLNVGVRVVVEEDLLEEQ